MKCFCNIIKKLLLSLNILGKLFCQNKEKPNLSISLSILSQPSLILSQFILACGGLQSKGSKEAIKKKVRVYSLIKLYEEVRISTLK